jgi:hypothetical protein
MLGGVEIFSFMLLDWLYSHKFYISIKSGFFIDFYIKRIIINLAQVTLVSTL